jgi:hypothetical protein
MKRQYKVGLAALAVMTAACSDSDPMGPGPLMLANVSTEVCQTITFNTTAGAADHMELWGGMTFEGVAVSASGERYVSPAGSFGGAMAPRLFYSPIQDAIEDDDLQYPAAGDCVDCQTLGLEHFLVLPDERTDGGDPFYGDYRWGGKIQLDFAAGLDAGTYYVKSWHAVDDDGGEPSIDLFADGVPVSSSTGTGDNTVETVTSAGPVYFTSTLVFEFGTEAQDDLTGSGGVDNIEICKMVDEPPPPPPPAEGRMTGGGVKAEAAGGTLAAPGTTVTLGLTLHCDNTLSNNLQVNWGTGRNAHQWHIEKETLFNILCTDEDIAPEPPAAPIDTFEADVYGRLDGVANSTLHFRFQDAGEPGKDDTIELTIYEPGTNVVALQVDFQKLSVGNFQMHYDQPHGQKPN